MSLFWEILSYPAGAYFFIWSKLITWTSTVRILRPETPYTGPAVYVNWHKHLPYLITHHGMHGRWMLVSRAPYMQSIARWCALSGIRLVRGASGENAKESLRTAHELLGRGESLIIPVDGPSGPAFEVKRGCAGLAKAAGYPIIPVAYRCKTGRPSARRWDRSLTPAFFDTITIEYAKPIFIDPNKAENEILSEIKNSLDRLDRGSESKK